MACSAKGRLTRTRACVPWGAMTHDNGDNQAGHQGQILHSFNVKWTVLKALAEISLVLWFSQPYGGEAFVIRVLIKTRRLTPTFFVLFAYSPPLSSLFLDLPMTPSACTSSSVPDMYVGSRCYGLEGASSTFTALYP